jgi:predicted O-methyltransferase YrrM
MKDIRSSYKENNYGVILRALVLAHKPKFVIEIGVLDGYSTFYIAHALRFNRNRGIISQFFAYDLWEEYDYKHGNFQEVEEMLLMQGLDKFVNLSKGDAFEVVEVFDNGTIDFIHMDISNDGDKLIKTLDVWGDKLSVDGIIAFEGGTKERDDVQWMKTFEFRPIRDVLASSVMNNWIFQVLTPFPGMTLLWKKK